MQEWPSLLFDIIADVNTKGSCMHNFIFFLCPLKISTPVCNINSNVSKISDRVWYSRTIKFRRTSFLRNSKRTPPLVILRQNRTTFHVLNLTARFLLMYFPQLLRISMCQHAVLSDYARHNRKFKKK